MPYKELIDKWLDPKTPTFKIIVTALCIFLLVSGYRIYENERNILNEVREVTEKYEDSIKVINALHRIRMDSVTKAEGDRKANYSLIIESEVRQRMYKLRNDLDAERCFLLEMHNGGGEMTALSEKHITVRYEIPENLPPDKSLKTVFTNRLVTSGVRALLTNVMLDGAVTVASVTEYKPFKNDSVHTKLMSYYNTKSLIAGMVGKDAQNVNMYFLLVLWDQPSPPLEINFGSELIVLAAAEEIRKKFGLVPINSAELRRASEGL